MALMAFSDSEVTNDKSCSKSCLKNYEALKKQYDDLLVKLDDTGFKATTYKRGLATLEDQIVKYREHEVRFSEEIALLKRSVGHKQYQLGLVRIELEKVKQEKEGFDFKIAKFDKSVKDLNEMLESQITDKSKKGYGLEEFKEPEVNEYGPRDSSFKPTIGCDKESNNSKDNTDDSLEQHQITDIKLALLSHHLRLFLFKFGGELLVRGGLHRIVTKIIAGKDSFYQLIDPLAQCPNASVQQYPTQSSESPQFSNQPSLVDNCQIDTGSTSTDNLIESLTNTLALLRTSSNARNKATVQDDRVVVQDVPGNVGGQNRVGNMNPGQAKPIMCYNCKGIGHIARESVVFLAENSPPNLLRRVMSWHSNMDHLPIYDEAGPSYDSNTPYTFVDHIDEYHEVHEMQSDVQHNYVVDSDADYTSDSNIIPYDQYVEDNEEHVVQNIRHWSGEEQRASLAE
ncbi:hypothetical protein Tco_0608790 [Tanacetum coccineum]